MKKILAALAASTMAIAMISMTATAETLDADDEIIEDVEEDIVDDTDDIIEEVTPDVEAPVTKPSTGNAPIALAVIPVALAAAAVVAKKAK